MGILGLHTSPSSGGAYALILQESEGNRRLPIIIGTYEAQAIALEMEHIKPPRPMTHDLLRNVIQSFNTYVKFVHINRLSEGTFFAEIAYDVDGVEMLQDARPSDAIALSVRFNAPIFVSTAVLDEAGLFTEPGEDEPEKAATPAKAGLQNVEAVKSKDTDSLQALQKRLDAAIADEDYEKAAKIRDEINRLRG